MSHIIKPADNLVLEFKENSDLRRKVVVFSTEDPDKFKVIQGLNAQNQISDTTFKGVAEVKSLWIDLVVNGYTCIRNELFKRGIKDCLPPPKVEEEEKIKVIYEGMVDTGLIGEPPISNE
jgi:hypothetical protein